MRNLGGCTLLSASDLMRFMGCTHATTLDLARMRGTGPAPREDSEDAALLQKQGDTHETAHLERLKAEGRKVIEVDRHDLRQDAGATRAALAEGPDVVFQGAFLSGNWGGWSDFLERVESSSDLGPFSYEVTDTKLKRRPHPKHVLQLVLYSDLLSELQGTVPEFAHIELGNGERATLRLADYASYARAARERFETFVASPTTTRPVPCADCALCRWGEHCEAVWQAGDSLFNVANITRGHVKKLEAAGVRTMEALASFEHPIRGMAEPTRNRLAICDVYQMMAYAHLYKAPRLTLLYPHHDGLANDEGIQAQFQITGRETLFETGSLDVADGKEILARLRSRVLLDFADEQLVLQ